MSGKRVRRSFAAERKAEVVRRHLSGKEAVSDLADELEVQPTQIHLWVKQVLDQAEAAFAKSPGKARRVEDVKDRQIAALEAKVAQAHAKLAQKNEVISELMQEHVQLKKELGEP